MIKVSPMDTGPSRVLTHLSEDQMPYKKRRSKPFQVQNSDTEQENGDAEKTCCVCEEIIMDTGRKKQAAVFCDGICQRWLHQSCAGLSVPAFEKVCQVEDPFYCNFCLGQQQNKQIKAIDINSQPASYAQITSEQSSQLSPSNLPKQPLNDHERRYNLVFLGIREVEKEQTDMTA